MTTGFRKRRGVHGADVDRQQRTRKEDMRFLVRFMLVSCILYAGMFVGVFALTGTKASSAQTLTRTTSKPAADAVTLKDFAIAPASSSVPAGLIDFTVTNNGPSPHELLVFRTDLDPGKLPLGADGRVNEDAEGMTRVFDSGDNIDVSASKTFNTALTAGRYVLVCNLPDHYKNGMYTTFTVL